MAERDYTRGEGITPIQEMSTRQLRKYIRERVEEAQKRLDSIEADKKLDISETSKAFQEQLDFVKSYGGRSGRIRKDTSRMTKVEMEEYAYAVRDLNMLDTESKYARDLEYKENKDRYAEFIKERTREDNPNKKDREYWKQFLTDKKNVRKAGYLEYKNFVNFLKNIDEVMASYGYETVKDAYYDETDKENKQVIADLLVEVYQENKGSGLSMGELVERFNERLEDHKKEKSGIVTAKAPEAIKTPKRSKQKKPSGKAKTPRSEKIKAPKKGKKPTVKESKQQKIKTKTRGMKNEGVRERKTTKKV